MELNAASLIASEGAVSFGQEALWLQHQLHPKSGCYNTIFAWEIPSDLHIETFKHALKIVSDRHAVLRTTYAINEHGELRSKTQASYHFRFEERVTGISTDDEVYNLIHKELHTPFDLATEVPIRWVLFRRNNKPYILIVIQHHILVDLWSYMVLMNNLEQIYGSLINNTPCTLSEPALTYRDYIEEQRGIVNTIAGQELAVFWRLQLANMPPALELQTDYPRPHEQTCNKTSFHFTAPDTTRKAFQQLATSPSSSLLSLYETLFHILLFRYTGQTDIAVSMPTSGRDDRYKGVYGYFANAIILRANVDGHASFRKQITQQSEIIESALKAKDYPYSLLASQFGGNRDQSRAPLAQVCFVWENINRFENRDKQKVFSIENGYQLWKLGEMGAWKRLPITQQIDDFDLTFKVYKFNDQLSFSIEYNRDLFSLATIERMAAHYCTLMDSVAVNPDAPIRTLNLLSSQEQQQVLHEWNKTHTDYNREISFVKKFETIVASYPQKTAIQFEGKTLTYAELDKQANRIAQLLLKRSMPFEARVGVMLERSPEIVMSILGILKSGAVYLPLDPEYPVDRLIHILHDAQPALIISIKNLKQKIPNETFTAEIIELDSDEILTASSAAPTIVLSPNQLAYIIFTSGSTGLPKGVMIEHRNLAHLMHAQQATFKVSYCDSVLQFASINFDASMFEMVMALQSGATLVMEKKENLLGEQLLQRIRHHAISWAVLPPSLLTSMEVQDLPTLKTLIVAGEACTQELADRWSANRDFYNAYGPTESTIWATIVKLTGGERPTIGTPIQNTNIFILDQGLNPQPVGIPGEIYIGGEGLARGYLNRPELTAEKFIKHPFSKDPDARLYQTGDLGRHLADGNIEFLGRIDHQVKIRGFRIEPGEIESVIRKHPSAMDALVIAKTNIPGRDASEKLLIAYIVKHPRQIEDTNGLRAFLRSHLPDYMIPSAFVWLNDFPMTPNEKIDRRALPEPCFDDNTHNEPIQLPATEIEHHLVEAWKTCLGLKQVSTLANFFDLGGHSLLLSKVYASLPATLRDALTMVDLYKYPTIKMLAQHACNHQHAATPHQCAQNSEFPPSAPVQSADIAIIGMAGRFPGANSVDDFWQNICEGKESIKLFTPEELRAAGVDNSLIHHPSYVPVKGALEDIAGFDANFFNVTPREAQITDPQQRLFLETAWRTLEDAGCDPNRFVGRIGIYGGSGFNHYLPKHLMSHPTLMTTMGDYAVMLGNQADFLCSRVAYKLNLRGPAVVIQTACSTSLVAVHSACQALLAQECDAALAGGVSLGALESAGYLFKEGMILSPDGHCRAFDAAAAGTVPAQGCGIVMLKRLEDALANRDHIYAVISGTAINNDGAQKSGFTAPSLPGQVNAIQRAHAMARITPDQITYIEAHGTGTPIGDPIELDALCDAFDVVPSPTRAATKMCAIGSVKTNVGHLDTAAGVTGLIKVAKALEQRQLPPSLHFTRPNPKFNFDTSPFYVNTQLQDWPEGAISRHAAVSSFGMGGTNAHVVLREAPSPATGIQQPHKWQLITLSARSTTALEAMSSQLATHLTNHKQQSFADVCYTLHTGRALFSQRRFFVCEDRTQAISALTSACAAGSTIIYEDTLARVVLLFSGQGSQYVNMGRELYHTEAVFKAVVDHCCTHLITIFPDTYGNFDWPDAFATNDTLHQTFVTQPSLFIIEYALAKLLMSWGITPDVMLGHSVGEFVAACLAGVFTLEHALELVALRGQLIQALPAGCMLSVRLGADEAARLVNDEISLAAINSDQRCVLAGSHDAIQVLHETLKTRGVESRIEQTSHAFHSHMMEPAVEIFAAHVARFSPQAPHTPYVSSLTGHFITTEQACSAGYWAEHIRATMQFHCGLNTILQQRDHTYTDAKLIFLEVGPGKALATLARLNSLKRQRDMVLTSTRFANEDRSDTAHLLTTLGHLWAHGVAIDWDAFHTPSQSQRVSLPTYPFTRLPYWVPSLPRHADTTTAEFTDLPPLPTLPDDGLAMATSTIVAPRNDMEEMLWKFWKICLGRDDFGVEDNFFDLGGDSLLAVGLFDRLRHKFPISLSTHLLIQYSTIAELAVYLHSQQANNLSLNSPADNDALIVLQRGDSDQIPLILVHPIGGEVFFYRDLARHLGNEQPVFAFQAPSLSGAEPPMNSVYTLAERYLSILKKRDFKPPYLLGGSSFGGLVAYEMAQQLKRYGEEVRLVVMIDTPAPSQMPRNLTDSAAILQYLLQGKLSLSLDKLRTLPQQAQIDYVLEEARLQGRGNALPPHLGVPLFSTWIAHQEATVAYTPEPYHDDAVFFQHTEPMENFPPDPSEAWKALVEGAMIVRHVPGNHISMNYPPHVRTLANHLKPILRGYLGG